MRTVSRRLGPSKRVRLVIAVYGFTAVVAYAIVLITVITILGLAFGAWVASGSPKPFILALGFAGLTYWLWFSDQSV